MNSQRRTFNEQRHYGYAGTDDGRGTDQRIDTKRLTLMSGTLCRPAAQRHDRASEADVLVRRLNSGVLVCGPVWLNRPVGGFVIGVGVGNRLGLVHLARLVVLRRVDGVDLHRLVADVGDVVPGTGRNDDAPAVGYLLVEGQFILAGSHLGSTPATVESNELVGVGVLLQSDVAVDRNRHEGDLEVGAAPGHGAVVRVLDRLGLQVERLGTGTDVCDAHALTIALSPSPEVVFTVWGRTAPHALRVGSGDAPCGAVSLERSRSALRPSHLP